jgi:hypothetical protein
MIYLYWEFSCLKLQIIYNKSMRVSSKTKYREYSITPLIYSKKRKWITYWGLSPEQAFINYIENTTGDIVRGISLKPNSSTHYLVNLIFKSQQSKHVTFSSFEEFIIIDSNDLALLASIKGYRKA